MQREIKVQIEISTRVNQKKIKSSLKKMPHESVLNSWVIEYINNHNFKYCRGKKPYAFLLS